MFSAYQKQEHAMFSRSKSKIHDLISVQLDSCKSQRSPSYGIDKELSQFLTENNLEEEASKFSAHEYDDLLQYENEDDIRQFGEDIGLDVDAQNRLVQGLDFRILDNPFSPGSLSFPRKISENATKECIVCLQIVETGFFGSPYCRMCGLWVCPKHSKKSFKKKKVCDKCYVIYEPFHTKTEGTVRVRLKSKPFDERKYGEINEKIKNDEHNKQMIERFDINKNLGGGTYGSVYKAFDRMKKREVAIKKICAKHKDSFFMEASLMKSCDNPFILKVDDLFYDAHKSEYCIVMELCIDSIEDKIRRCSDFEILHIAHDVLSALVYLHDRKIIHRDIKPANILLHPSGAYKVADFGIGKAVLQSKAKTFTGTSEFMAPEIEHCKYSNVINYDESVDIWAFGQTIFVLINGHHLNWKCAYSEASNRRKTTNIKKYFKQMAIKKCIIINSKLRSSATDLLKEIKQKYLYPGEIQIWAANKIVNESTLLQSVFQPFLQEFVENNWQNEFHSFAQFEHVVDDAMMRRFGMKFDATEQIDAAYKLMSNDNEEKENEILLQTKLKFVTTSFVAYGKINGNMKLQNIKKCAVFDENNALFVDCQHKVYSNMNIGQPLSINVRITKVACGNGHSLLLSQDGTLWAYGKNEYGQCTPNGDFIKKPQRCSFFKDIKVNKIAAGDSHSAVICSQGFVYMFGDNYYGQCGAPKDRNKRTPQRSSAAKHVACGGKHTLVISSNHHIYGCGYNANGQVGTGRNKHTYAFTPIRINSQHAIVDADCGSVHSLCISKDGNAYSWGHGGYGQLGHGNDTSHKYVPMPINSNHRKYIRCFCGYSHSALLDEDHNLFTFGSNEYGELCHLDKKQKYTPTKVTMKNVKITDVTLGEDQTFLVVENEGVIKNYSEKDAIQTDEVYDIYAQNKRLFGLNDDWIKIRENVRVNMQKQSNADKDVDDEKDKFSVQNQKERQETWNNDVEDEYEMVDID